METIQNTQFNQDELILVEYDSTYSIQSKAEFDELYAKLSDEDIDKLIDAGTLKNPFLSTVRKIKNIEEQGIEIDQLQYELKQAVEMLEVLTENAFRIYKEKGEGVEYLNAMQNVSSFITSNIVNKVSAKVEDLNKVLQYSWNKRTEVN